MFQCRISTSLYSETHYIKKRQKIYNIHVIKVFFYPRFVFNNLTNPGTIYHFFSVKLETMEI